MKHYFSDGTVTIYHGDCREILPALDLRVDALVTDPPYGIGFADYASHDDDPDEYAALILTAIERAEAHVLDGWAAVYQSATTATRWSTWIPRDWRPIALPKTFTQVLPGKWPIAATDYVLLWQIGEPQWPEKGKRVRDWLVQPTSDMSKRPKGHPCPRPLSGVQHVIDMTTPPGGVAIDPFMGSGTTLVAAKNMGRLAIGIEREEKYCEIAARRMSQQTLFAANTA